MSDHVRTFLTEGQAFVQAHREEVGNDSVVEFGGWVWGLMRAIAECPNCPGVFRVPTDDDWTYLVCPQCKGVWAHKGD